MSTIYEKYQQSQLADAAYANFIDPQTGLPYTHTKGITDALQDQNNNMQFTATQATAFATQYRVVDQIPDTVNGFSATVLEKLGANGSGTGQYILAPRGTNDGVDTTEADLKQIMDIGSMIKGVTH